MEPGGTERLWAAPEANALAANGEAARSSRVDAEVGYGMAVFGGGFTGTPNLGYGVSDGGAREYRMGWRLTWAGAGNPGGFELNLDATRSEPAGANEREAEHGIMLRSLIRW